MDKIGENLSIIKLLPMLVNNVTKVDKIKLDKTEKMILRNDWYTSGLHRKISFRKYLKLLYKYSELYMVGVFKLSNTIKNKLTNSGSNN